MGAGVSQAKKLSCGWKRRKESLDRKSRTGAGRNKYLDLCMTQGSPLQPFLSPPAPIKRGPNWFEHPRGEKRIAQNFQILYCDFEAA